MRLPCLVGQELIQVCIGANELILNFDGNVRVTIETEIEHRTPEGVASCLTNPRAAAPFMVGLLESRIRAASVIPPGTVVLKFSNGEEVEISDSNEHYESYQIVNGDDWIVV
ncbi:MAG: DUF6188 family protein [Planctomycetales bacterium]